MTRTTLAIALAAVAATAAPAAAATPETGSLPKASGSNPLVQSWTGEAYGQPFKAYRPLQRDCIAPFCDEFNLTLTQAGALKIRLSAPTSAFYVDAEVVQPDGTVDYIDGNDTDTFAEFLYDEALLGSYRIRIWPNALIGIYDGQYTGKATLTLPPAA